MYEGCGIYRKQWRLLGIYSFVLGSSLFCPWGAIRSPRRAIKIYRHCTATQVAIFYSGVRLRKLETHLHFLQRPLYGLLYCLRLFVSVFITEINWDPGYGNLDIDFSLFNFISPDLVLWLAHNWAYVLPWSYDYRKGPLSFFHLTTSFKVIAQQSRSQKLSYQWPWKMTFFKWLPLGNSWADLVAFGLNLFCKDGPRSSQLHLLSKSSQCQDTALWSLAFETRKIPNFSSQKWSYLET